MHEDNQLSDVGCTDEQTKQGGHHERAAEAGETLRATGQQTDRRKTGERRGRAEQVHIQSDSSVLRKTLTV